MIPIHDGPSELPGLASEESVLKKNTAHHSSGKIKINYVGFDDSMSFRDGSISGSGEVMEKRTRFSLSHDEGSIGNTSDNLEAISEAASNHSVASSLEDEVDQVEDPIIDNLSDMVSASLLCLQFTTAMLLVPRSFHSCRLDFSLLRGPPTRLPRSLLMVFLTRRLWLRMAFQD